MSILIFFLSVLSPVPFKHHTGIIKFHLICSLSAEGQWTDSKNTYRTDVMFLQET